MSIVIIDTCMKSLHDFMIYSQACVTSGEFNTSLTAFLGHSGVNDDTVMITCTNYTISADTSVFGFCRGSTSFPRGFVSVELGAKPQSAQCENTALVVDTGRAVPLMGDQQCDSLPHV